MGDRYEIKARQYCDNCYVEQKFVHSFVEAAYLYLKFSFWCGYEYVELTSRR